MRLMEGGIVLGHVYRQYISLAVAFISNYDQLTCGIAAWGTI